LSADDEEHIFQPFGETLNSCPDKKTKGYVPQACMRTKTFWKVLAMGDPNRQIANKMKHIQQLETSFDNALRTWQRNPTQESAGHNTAFGYTQKEISDIKFKKLPKLWEEDRVFENAIQNLYPKGTKTIRGQAKNTVNS